MPKRVILANTMRERWVKLHQLLHQPRTIPLRVQLWIFLIATLLLFIYHSFFGYHLIKNGPFPSKWSPSDILFATQMRRAIVVVAVSCLFYCIREKWKLHRISSHLGVEFFCLYLGLNSCTGLLSSSQLVLDFGLAVITVSLSVYFCFLTIQVAIRDSRAPKESQTLSEVSSLPDLQFI